MVYDPSRGDPALAGRFLALPVVHAAAFSREARAGPLCPHGHEDEGYADANLQRRFLMLAKLGYVVLATPQDHHEDILHGYAYQSYLTWNNMRAIGFLETLPEGCDKVRDQRGHFGRRVAVADVVASTAASRPPPSPA